MNQVSTQLGWLGFFSWLPIAILIYSLLGRRFGSYPFTLGMRFGFFLVGLLGCWGPVFVPIIKQDLTLDLIWVSLYISPANGFANYLAVVLAISASMSLGAAISLVVRLLSSRANAASS